MTKKVSDLDYVIDTPDRHKARRLCHVNMLEKYHGKETDGAAVCTFQNADERRRWMKLMIVVWSSETLMLCVI